jgi:hypothetical protein
MPGAKPLTKSHRTAPNFWWVRTLETDVNKMVDMDVTIAILMDRSSATPMLPSKKLNTGTIIKPPPKPNNPAMNPTTVPVRASSKKI